MNLTDHPAVARVLSTLATVLAPQGFTLHEEALIRKAPSGDWLIVSLEATGFAVPPATSFRVTVGVVPRPWLAWLRGQDDAAVADQLLPEDGDAMTWERLSPHTFDGESYEVRTDADADAAAAADILARLQSTLPRYEALLDRAVFLRRVRDRETRLDGRLNPSRKVAELILLIDGPPCRELTERQTDELELASANDVSAVRFVRWFQRYRESLGLQP